MKPLKTIMLLFILASCGPLGQRPRNIDWETTWQDNSTALKALLETVKTDTANFINGNHPFPDNFAYPFDEGFFLKRRDNFITVTFYFDRGLMDHYSAFVYTNDIWQISVFDSKIEDEGNDYRLEENWYCIHD